LVRRDVAAGEKENDRIGAGNIADCLRCGFLPECHMVSTEIRDRRRTLRYRHLLVRQMVQMKNRVSGLLLETSVSHNKQRLDKVKYFREWGSGQNSRMQINPGGNRRLNWALHVIAIVRLRVDGGRSKQFVERLTSNGKSQRAALRLLKTYIAREIFRTMRQSDALPPYES
ncbi:MAG: hypothetical protein ACR2JB_25350, partial [Bryobacteraceae bacterium]